MRERERERENNIYIYIYMCVCVCVCVCVFVCVYIGRVSRVFANGPGDPGLIPGRVIPKTQKMVLDISLLNTQHHKVCIKGKIQGKEHDPSRHLGVVAIQKKAFGSPSTTVANFTYIYIEREKNIYIIRERERKRKCVCVCVCVCVCNSF